MKKKEEIPVSKLGLDLIKLLANVGLKTIKMCEQSEKCL